jgi:hypothetical protein
MSKHGGKRENAGRKPKDEEQNLIEKLSPLNDLAFKALEKGLRDGASWAVKLYFEYNYGKPKETKDINLTSENPIFNGIDLDVR